MHIRGFNVVKVNRKFGLIDKLAYMSGDLANDLSFMFVMMYLMVFYTKVLGVSGAVVGILFLIARVVDAFTDIGMGRIVDVISPKKEGKFRFWIKYVAPFVCLAAFLLFVYVVKDFSMPVKIAYIFVTYILWGSICYTAINIPYGSMASVISTDPVDRASLSIYRTVGSQIATLLIAYAVPKVIFVEKIINGKAENVISPQKFTMIAAVFAILAFIFYMLCYKFSIERVKISASEPKNSEKKSIITEIKKIARGLKINKSLQVFLIFSIIYLLTTMLGNALSAYLYIDYFKSKEVLAYSGMVGAILTFIISPIAGIIVQKIGKKNSGAIGLLISGIIYLILYVVKLTNVWTFFICFVLCTIGISYFNIIVWAFITDIIDDQEVRTGCREDGTVYAVYSFSRKLGHALAGGMTGFALSYIGYNSSAILQTASVERGIYSVFTLVGGLGCVICGLILFFIYPLGVKQVKENTRILESRREEKSAK